MCDDAKEQECLNIHQLILLSLIKPEAKSVWKLSWLKLTEYDSTQLQIIERKPFYYILITSDLDRTGLMKFTTTVSLGKIYYTMTYLEMVGDNPWYSTPS